MAQQLRSADWESVELITERSLLGQQTAPTRVEVDSGDPPPTRLTSWETLTCAGTSMLIHMLALLIMALTMFSTPKEAARYLNLSQLDPADEPITDLALPTVVQPLDERTLSFEVVSEVPPEPPVSDVSVGTAAVAELEVTLDDADRQALPTSELLGVLGSAAGAALEGRVGENRKRLLLKNGGSEGSERAVALALDWFARHQRSDGSWTLDQSGGPCRGECSHNGLLNECYTGATALALLPFLGAGQTHEQGQYTKVVRKGMDFLMRTQDSRTGAIVSNDGGMYAHGLSTIVLCEAYAMTRAEFIRDSAQAAINFITKAQHANGGWRYVPRQAGDTSAVAWQLMALKSGHMGSFDVPTRSVARVSRFLDSVQSEQGARYGYLRRGGRPSTTAAGLLCRMYLGWNRNQPALEQGIEFLSARGPAPNEAHTHYHMYYNYYATQVLRHYGGEHWDQWNERIRDPLVDAQRQTGHMKGTWDIPNWPHVATDTMVAGRLYYTSLATMILEVYYRHLPIYSEEVGADDFPL